MVLSLARSAFKQNFFNVFFTFERREVNVEAHSLAKFSLSLDPGRHFWFGQSHDLNRISHVVDFDE